MDWLARGKRIIGIGPMSENCVAAVFRYSHDHSCPIEIIASRRQIEAREFGGGYVNNWCTEDFGAHISKMRKKYPKSLVVLCRDHGGPWQGYHEEGLPFNVAMERAKKSFEADISSGFDLLHIDPSIDGDGEFSFGRAISAGCQLLSHCHTYAKKQGKEILFEVGTEENVGKATSSEVFEEGLGLILAHCKKESIPHPIFVVGQTGSLVKEMRQVGNFDSKGASKLVLAALKHGVFFKEHNADYLSEYQLSERQGAKIQSMNVAPEFGAIESRAFVDLCMENGRRDLVPRFIALSIASGKWKKWVVDKSKISDYDLGMISGHYVFATKEFQSMLGELGKEKFDRLAQESIHSRIDFYCR